MVHAPPRREMIRQFAAFLLASPLMAEIEKPDLKDSTKLANVFDFRE